MSFQKSPKLPVASHLTQTTGQTVLQMRSRNSKASVIKSVVSMRNRYCPNSRQAQEVTTIL